MPDRKLVSRKCGSGSCGRKRADVAQDLADLALTLRDAQIGQFPANSAAEQAQPGLRASVYRQARPRTAAGGRLVARDAQSGVSAAALLNRSWTSL